MAPPFVVCLRPLNDPLVHGCPGVMGTLPRLEGVLEIRLRDNQPFTIRAVLLGLDTLQKVAVPSTVPGSSTASRRFPIYKNNLAYVPLDNALSEEVVGVDIPFVVPIPRDITPSGRFPYFGALTTHELRAMVAWDGKTTEVHTETFEVQIKTYDALPVFGQFNEPILQTDRLPDSAVMVEYRVPTLAIGPGDQWTMELNISANQWGGQHGFRSRLARASGNTNIRLKGMKLEMLAILECHEGGLPPRKVHRLVLASSNYDVLIDSNGWLHKVSLGYPFGEDAGDAKLLAGSDNSGGSETTAENTWTINSLPGALAAQQRPAAPVRSSTFASLTLTLGVKRLLRLATTQFATPAPRLSIPRTFTDTRLVADTGLELGVPPLHMHGFTSKGQLFSVRFEVALRLKFEHAKNHDIVLPVTVAPFSRTELKQLLRFIAEQYEACVQQYAGFDPRAKTSWEVYQREVEQRCTVREATTFQAHDNRDWALLGLSDKAMAIKGVLYYID